MSIRFRMSTAAGALLAATVMGAAGMAAAQVQSGAADAVVVAPGPDDAANTDNGVRAAPSGQVSEASLPGSPQTASGRPAAVADPGAQASLEPTRLRVGLAVGAPDPAPPQAQAADPAPAPPADEQPVVFQGRSAQLTALDTLPAAFPAVAEPEDADPAAVDGAPVQDSAPVQAIASDEPGPEEARAYGLVQRDPAPAPAAAEIADASTIERVRADEAPAPPSMQQHVSFPRRSVEAAAAFDGYMQSAAALGVELRGGQDVAAALKTAAAYEPKQLEEGMIAYGAIAALQNARFVYAVMDAGADDRSRRAMIEAILQDPHAASRLPGAEEAAAGAAAAILRAARPVILEGKALKQASYDVQHQSWSTAKAMDGAGRLSQAKAQSALHFSARDGDMARVLTRITALKDDDYARGSAHGEAASRSVALAALAILDGGRTQEDGGLDRLLSEYSTTECLKMAKLNLFQCLSVAGPEYEDVYCLGKHAVLDTGQCIAAAADPAETMQFSALTEPRRSR